ncbi:IclR family transcriptional regulator [Sphingobium sp. JS3065]|jgi:DNA-binding IclR family transcriptional regulator|uniref:IclR family transcriptional regulator n=1 Tax=Sphingobium sp. JS3065 TaxID=2970925 RepID=UPI002263AD75|nr:IclR family transcriptional regulator [Sphingobium sp. JS3065]UZW57468.1 IclR family transcriptional regulator [Sphingobium sp. JS3065]
MAAEQNTQVKSADRVLDLFELLSRSSRGVSHSNIADRLGIPKSSLTPLLRNMVLRGYVILGADGRSYQLGPQLLKLVRIGRIASDLAKEATSFLQQATREIGETSAFNQLHDDQQEVVATVTGRHRLTTHMKVGEVAPLYATSGGKAMLALMPEDYRNDYYKRVQLEASTESTIVRRAALEKQLEEVRKTGVAYSFEEWTSGIVGVGVAVAGPDDFPIGSINFAIPAARYNEELGKNAARALKRCAADMGRLFDDFGGGFAKRSD